jgi:hypothetical protein
MIAMLQEQRDVAEQPEFRKEIRASLLDEMSRRDGLYRAPDRRRHGRDRRGRAGRHPGGSGRNHYYPKHH